MSSAYDTRYIKLKESYHMDIFSFGFNVIDKK
jgi:hypothetical protein